MRVAVLFLSLGAFFPCFPQSNFAPLLRGLSAPGAVTAFADSTSASLILGGWFGLSDDTLLTVGVSRWDGTHYHAVGCGIGLDCINPPGGQPGTVNPVRSFAIWDGDLYVGGDSSIADGQVVNRIARFDRTN